LLMLVRNSWSSAIGQNFVISHKTLFYPEQQDKKLPF